MKRLSLLLLSLMLCLFGCRQGNDGGGKQNSTEDPELVLKYLEIHKVKITNLSKLEVTLDKGKTQVTKDDVVAKFDYGKEKDKTIDVEVSNGSLRVGDNTIKLSVKASKGHYKDWKQEVKITIKKTFDLKLDELIIHTVKAIIDKEPYTCEIDSKHKNITSLDITATFKLGSSKTKVIPLTVENCPAELEYGKPTTIHLVAPASEDEYSKWEHDVVVTRKALSPQIDSVITEFVVNEDFYELGEVKKEKTFESNVRKAKVLLATNRVFSKIESTAFDVEYPDNYKKDATLTLKEDLVFGTPVAVSIDVVTKEANQNRDDKPIKLEFSLTLKKGTIQITSVSCGNLKIENEGEALNVSSTPCELQLNFKLDSCLELTASLEKKDGSNKTNGTIYGPIATFSSIALEEGINEFVAKASAINATAVQFAFKVNYTKIQAEKVNIMKVEVDEKPVNQDDVAKIDKKTGVIVKVYLDKEYEKAKVTINNAPTTQPFAPGNKKIFQGVLQDIEDEKDIIIKATAENKTDSTFSFKVKYIKPAPKYITKILALGDEDFDGEGNPMFATLTDEGNNTFSTLLTGLNLKELKVEIADLHGDDASKLKVEFSKEGITDKMTGTFVEDGGKYVSSLSNIIDKLKALSDTKATSFTLKLFLENTLLETCTLNIKGSEAPEQP